MCKQDCASHKKNDISLYNERRTTLLHTLKERYSSAAPGVVLLMANFERETVRFRQESSFYYMTGIQEPATMLMLDQEAGTSTVYIPDFGKERAKWVHTEVHMQAAAALGVDAVAYAGNPCKGYQCHPFFTHDEYAHVLEKLQWCVAQNRPIYTLFPQTGDGYMEQRFIVQRMQSMVPGLSDHIVDISAIIAQMRRKKSHREIELLYEAIGITEDAHDAFARALSPEKMEYELQATIDYMFAFSGTSCAFPSIVASGKNGVILHYTQNTKMVEQGELVVVDIGAEYQHYCADISRTYPVSGIFNKRQRELYLIVLETQEYIASLAKPGMWLSYKEKPEESLHHLAQNYLKERGYDRYFPHGIGHFLGLDVHDVGDYTEPLAAGDVITIEPGIYIPEENIGIRIEDDYWVVKDGVICLSEDLPRHPDDIERMVQRNIEKE